MKNSVSVREKCKQDRRGNEESAEKRVKDRDKWRKKLKGGDEQEVVSGVGGRLIIGGWRTYSRQNENQNKK